TMEEKSSMQNEEIYEQSKNVKVGNVALQPRDIDLLRDVFENRFITITHAALLHFSNLKSADASAKRRLARLAEVGLLGKQIIPLEKHKTIFTFTKKAYDILAECGVLPQITAAVWDSKMRKRFSGIKNSTIEHEIGMLDIKAALAPAIQKQAHLRIIDFGIWPQAYEFKFQRGGSFPTFQPDGFLAVAEHRPAEAQPTVQYFYLELDRGTESLDKITEKMKAYRYHLREGGFGEWIGKTETKISERTFRAAFVVDTANAAKRIQNMCETFEKRIRNARSFHEFGRIGQGASRLDLAHTCCLSGMEGARKAGVCFNGSPPQLI
ncbi:replication-relaxation family protein, partial [Candidatus Sumerlaeota bacterium]